ncbi:MAG: hypothetical protein ABSF22_08085 [Bryobacteraceae bacterium]
MRSNLRLISAIGLTLGFLETAGAVSFTNTQAGPATWVYTLTFAPEDNYSITQSTTTITLNGLTGVTAAAGPTSTDFPTAALNASNLLWTAQVKNGGTTVVWTIGVGGTGNFGTYQHVYGFSITANAPSGTASLVTSGFSRDTPNPLPGGGLDLDISGNAVGPASTTQVVLPQFVFGGGWYSAVYFTNTGTTLAQFNLTATADNGTPLPLPAAQAPFILAPQATGILEALNTGTLSQGYVTAQLPPGVEGYGVFRQSVPGLPDQEAVVPLSLASNVGDTLIYDDTSYTTAAAIANPTPVTITVSITIANASGNSIGTTTLALAPFSHTAAILRSLPGLGGMVGQRGLATFSVANGNVAVLGLRFNGSAFTSIPAVGQ